MSFIIPWKFNIYIAGILFLLFLTLDGAECKGDAEKMKALHKKLLDGYDPLIRPSTNYSNPTAVTVELGLSIILGLDAVRQVILLRAFLNMKWKDEFLQWDPKDFGDIDSIVLPQKRIWKPDLIIFNSVNGHASFCRDEMLMIVNSKGQVAWNPEFYLEGFCQLDMSKYPYDSNKCFVAIQSWSLDNTSVTLVSTDKPVNLEFMFINGEFEILPEGVAEYDPKGFESLHFHLRLTRRSLYINLSVMLPITLLALLSIVPFMLPPEESGKVELSMTVLLAFTVFLDVIDEKIPHTSDHLCIIVFYIGLLLILSFLCAVGNAFVVALRCWDEAADKEAAKSNTKPRGFGNNPQNDDIEEKKTNIYGPRSHDLTEVDKVSTSSVTKTMVKTGKKCLHYVQRTRAAKVNTAFAILAGILLISIEVGIRILYVS